MFKKDLGFLDAIFIHNDINELNILIVNQTTEDMLLTSEYSNIKVINSFERGSPASRNLAIRNASCDVCLMADDDMVYQPNLKQKIENAYAKHPNADMISLQAVDEHNNPYTKYYPQGRHNKKTLMKIFTCVISFKREVYKQNEIYFNHYFGVGSVFKGATEYVFLRNAFDKGLKMRHVAETIVIHFEGSSGKQMGSDNALFAKTALRQRFLGNLSYLWLLKYVFFLWRKKYIKANEVIHKINMGLNGIKTYKQLKTSGEIDKIYEV
jgi:glycosyltransferase involved in cell wall biosynthesis